MARALKRSGAMSADLLASIARDLRTQTITELRRALLGAGATVLQRLAVDLVPPLFRNDYRGEAASSGPHWAEALARPRVAALPTFLVRVHAGDFTSGDAAALRATMEDAGIAQAALVVITPGPLRSDIRTLLGPAVPWLLDTEGLVNLMVNASVGLTTVVLEAKSLDPAYFR